MTAILLTAGGTGGHLFPCLAVAEALHREGYAVTVVTDERGRRYAAEHPTITLHALPITAMAKGRGRALWTFLHSLYQSYALLRRQRPAGVVGFGGYPALPLTLMAGVLGYTVVLHEQNAILGRANRLVVRQARAVATAFPDLVTKTKATPAITITGNPVRQAFHDKRYPPYKADPTAPFRILITGGSQGAASFSMLFPEALALFSPEQRRRLSLVQQCRAEDIDAVRARYAALGVAATLASFFTDMPERLAACDLFIGRAGASTIAEVTLVGRAGLYIPYPYAMDDHQAANAEQVVAAGAGWCFRQAEATPAALRDVLVPLLENRQPLAAMAAAAARFAHPEAVKSLVKLIKLSFNS